MEDKKFTIEINGENWNVKETNEGFLCSFRYKFYFIPDDYVYSLTSPLSIEAALKMVLSALASKYYVAAKQPTRKNKSVPVYGSDNREDCLAWMENQIGYWELVHNVEKVKITFTDGTGDSIPMAPPELGNEVMFSHEPDMYHFFVIVLTEDVNKLVDWYNDQYQDVSEGVLKVEHLDEPLVSKP